MIIPAILENDWAPIEEKLKISQDFANTVHVDFIDGMFADDISFLEFLPFKEYSEYFTLEAHLMVEEPVNYLDRLSAAGFKRVLGHVERMTDQVEFIAKGQELGAIGLALDLHTSLEEIEVSLEDLDQILLMSVIAGKSGQKFDESVLPKIKELKERGFTNIEIDGGINDITLPKCKKEGANMFAVTSFLFENDPKENYKKLQSLL